MEQRRNRELLLGLVGDDPAAPSLRLRRGVALKVVGNPWDDTVELLFDET